MNKPKRIGTAAETAVARFLQVNGFPHAERRALRGIQDAGDITGCPGICIEVKGGEAAKSASDQLVMDWLVETETERANAGADVGVLVLQRRGVGPANAGRWWVVFQQWPLYGLQLLADRDITGAPAYTGTEPFVVTGTDPVWMRAPVRMLLADAVLLLRAAGYGQPLEEMAS
jgi:hypothetical protein